MSMTYEIKKLSNFRRLFSYTDNNEDYKEVVRGCFGVTLPHIFEFASVDIHYFKPRLFLPDLVIVKPSVVLFRVVIKTDSVAGWRLLNNNKTLSDSIDFTRGVTSLDINMLEEFQQVKKVYKRMVNQKYGEIPA